MFKRQYKPIKIGPDRLAIIKNANRLISEYRQAGYTLTLRQLYYRFIAGDLLPEDWGSPQPDGTFGTRNTQKNYKRLGDVISDGRMAGLIDWEGIEDRTRELARVSHWDSPADILEGAHSAFRLDKWVDQLYRVECWVEKDALEGIVKQAAHAMDVSAFSCRGYTSASSMWEAARRLGEYVKDGQRPVILHLGDFDPSGLDMTRDIEDRLNDFVESDWLYDRMGPEGITTAKRGEIWKHIEMHMGHGQVIMAPAKPITVKRIALTREQIEQYDPPPNPAKATDARYKKFQEEHGDESWELDALEPSVLDDLITSEIEKLRNEDRFNDQLRAENRHREILLKAATQWNSGLSDTVRDWRPPGEDKPVKKKKGN